MAIASLSLQPALPSFRSNTKSISRPFSSHLTTPPSVGPYKPWRAAAPLRSPPPASVFPKLSAAVIDDEDDPAAEKVSQNNSIADFMRFKRGVAGGEGAVLQTAVVSYRKRLPWSLLQPFRNYPLSPFGEIFSCCCRLRFLSQGVGLNFLTVCWCLQVDLVSKFHIADKEYFEVLQRGFESYDCILYEMVASRESLENRLNSEAPRKLKSSRSKGFNVIGFIQRQMARVLSLDFQLDCLDYELENWHHADLDYETFKLLQS